MKIRKYVLVITLFALLIGMLPFQVTGKSTETTKTTETTETIVPATAESTATATISKMGIGWNVGNNLDSIDYKRSGDVTHYETLWGNPVITKELIQNVYASGFQTLRIPVSYYDHLDSDGNIDEAWLKRVEEIVNYGLDAGMYCIINVMHDTGSGSWIKADYDNVESNKKKLVGLWTQIADYFKDYDNRVIFEGFNEILDKDNHWSTTSEDNYKAVNILNQSFVDTVRQSGGNNAERILMINGYSASAETQTLEAIEVPKDTVKDHLIVGVHVYKTEAEQIDTIVQMLQKKFLANNIPVVVGEWGTESSDDTVKKQCITNVVSKMTEVGIPCIWWDNGKGFGLFDRATGKCVKQDMLQLILECYQNAKQSTDVADDDVVTDDTAAAGSDTESGTDNDTTDKEANYTEVESLKLTSWSGFSNTIMLDDKSSYEVTFSLPTQTSYGNIVSVTTSGGSKIFALRQEQKKLYSRYVYSNEAVKTITENEVMTVKQEIGKTIVNGTQSVTTSYRKMGSGALKLGTCPMTLYSFKAWKDGVLVADCIPVDHEDAGPCLYNQVDNMFWYFSGNITTNAKAS